MYAIYVLFWLLLLFNVSRHNNLHGRLKVNIYFYLMFLSWLLFSNSYNRPKNYKQRCFGNSWLEEKVLQRDQLTIFAMNNICIIHMVIEYCYSFQKLLHSFYGWNKRIFVNSIFCPLYKALIAFMFGLVFCDNRWYIYNKGFFLLSA